MPQKQIRARLPKIHTIEEDEPAVFTFFTTYKRHQRKRGHSKDNSGCRCWTRAVFADDAWRKGCGEWVTLTTSTESEPALTFLSQPTPPGYMVRARCRADYSSFKRKQENWGLRSRSNIGSYSVFSNTSISTYPALRKCSTFLRLPPARFRIATDCYQ